MSEIVPPALINKLGHNILEIRERALLTLLSKIDNGFIFENDLAQSKEILKKLFEWFLYTPCPQEEMVLALIKRIFLTKSGAALITHYGPKTIKKELKQVKGCLEPEYHSNVDELLEIVEAFKEDTEVIPPLQCDVPLSYRSGQSCRTSRQNIDTTARTFSGFIDKSSSLEAQVENPIQTFYTPKQTYSVDKHSEPDSYNLKDVLPNFTFQWQPLIDADKHVLDSIENSLKNPSQPSDLLHSCEFFSDVLLHDFPGEVFLQRPKIVRSLEELLLTSTSTRINISILNCLFNLTKALLRRIDYCNDPCMRCLKEYAKTCSQSSSSTNSTISLNEEVIKFKEDTKTLKEFELPTPEYALKTLKCVLNYLLMKPLSSQDTTRKKHFTFYNAVILIQQLMFLLKRCFKQKIWEVQPHGMLYNTLKNFNECLVSFGDLIENYRIEIHTDETNSSFRSIQLCVLYHCMYFIENFIPTDKSSEILPKYLKNTLAMTLLDIPIARLYPELYKNLLNYVKMSTKESDSLNKFRTMNEICDSMSAAVKFIRNHDSTSFSTLMELAKTGILSLQFHENLCFVDIVIEVLSTQFGLYSDETDASNMEDVILRLLSHHIVDVAERAYELCHKKIISAIGPTLNYSGGSISSSQIVFLLRPKIFVEIAEFGLSSKNTIIKKFAEDIFIYLVKCKILVTDDIWDKVKEALLPSLPIVLLYASKKTPLGRMLINVVDPDIAKDLRFQTLHVIRSNILLLFSPEDAVRDESFSRLCWLLAVQENSKNLLPRLNNINDKTLPNACQTSLKNYDVNKSKSTDRFYQPSSLHHVMELLHSPNVEPSIRRSALTQVGVMMEDHLLHEIFIEKGGVDLVIKIMENSLIEDDYMNYADSVIPAVAILKCVCLYSCKVRFELSYNLNLYYCILRGVFLFCTEERMKSDSSVLLFLLLYSNFIEGTPFRANMAIPKIVREKFVVPFTCETSRESSDYTNVDITDYILNDESCLSSIQIHWNSEVYGGFQELLQLECKNTPTDIKVTDRLKIETKDLNQIRVSSVEFSIAECLKEMKKGDNFANTEEILNALMIYVYLYDLSKSCDNEAILKYPWEENFSKFLRILPSSEEDANLLQKVIKFLKNLVHLYKNSKEGCWIIKILRDPTHYITDFIDISNSSEEYSKIISRELIDLITECVCQEQRFIDFRIDADENSNTTTEWANIIENITDSLKFKDPQQLYNLAYLDSLLSCLVHLSATLGWSKARKKITPKYSMKDIISGLCDLVDAFHYGKGPTAAASLMGLSITRNVLLILNHILAEVSNANIKNWDLLFIDDMNEHSKVFNFIVLWSTRDTILRAAVLQFFAGLMKSTRLSRDIISHLKKKQKCLWSMTLNVLLDSEEASIVRENAALILANLCTHRVSANNMKILHSELTPIDYKKKVQVNPIEGVLEIIEQNNCVKQFKTLLLCLYTNNISDLKVSESQESTSKSSHLYSYHSDTQISEKSWNSNSSETKESMNIVTPGLVKALVIFLHNLIEMTQQTFIDYINDAGLIKLIFRSICIPSIELKTTKELSLYVDLLEMNSEICFFLNKAVRCSPICLGTVLHTKDCVNLLFSLLNSENFDTHLPQLLYLRNKLWTEIFSVMGAFLECGYRVEDPLRTFEILGIILEAIHNCGAKNWVATTCEAIGSFAETDLQTSVLITLTLMLQTECSFQLFLKNRETKNVITMKHSMQNLLDNVKADNNYEIEKKLENHKLGRSQSEDQSSKYKMNLLEKLYYGESVERISKPQEHIKKQNRNKVPVAGAEICKILLHLYEIYDVRVEKENVQKQVILAATSSVLCVSNEAKYYALDTGFLQTIMENFRELSIKLSLESIDCFRRVEDKKRISPLLKDLDSLTGLLTNFLLENVAVKCEASTLGLADIIHKVWNWSSIYKSSLINLLKLLSSFTTNCPFACQSLPYTSSIIGTGPRKSTSNVSLLHEIVSKISREMDMLSKTHDLLPLRLCFNILQNCSSVLECRISVTKSNLLQGMTKLHPAVTKRQKPWETVELIWLDYLKVFTVYPEGQMFVGKLPEILDLILNLSQTAKLQNKIAALSVLQNLAFYTPNRARLLTTSNFINTLSSKLQSGTNKEKIIVVNTMWALAANNVKAKTVFKSAKLDLRLSEALKKIQLLNDGTLTEQEVDRMQYVLDILKESDVCR